MATFVYSGVTYTAPAVGTTELPSPLTQVTPLAICLDHIYVYSSTDAGVTGHN